ncbi:hypothetical protein L249_2814, partial [Ophiocordyceps polyrhachis-furcata BCC 54312]
IWVLHHKHVYITRLTQKTLNRPWKATDWRASDDRVRKGKSHSYLTISPDGKTASFNGTLDTQTLGGAGFASQRTADEDLCLDLTAYDGIVVSVLAGDEQEPKPKTKKFALTLSDVKAEKSKAKKAADDDDDREEGSSDLATSRSASVQRDAAVLSWEAVFCAPVDDDKVVRLAWADFVPTYRGREVKGAKPLDLSRVRRVALMMRSFFGEQSGEFQLEIRSIAAYQTAVSPSRLGPAVTGNGRCGCDVDDALSLGDVAAGPRPSCRGRAGRLCCVMHVCLSFGEGRR